MSFSIQIVRYIVMLVWLHFSLSIFIENDFDHPTFSHLYQWDVHQLNFTRKLNLHRVHRATAFGLVYLFVCDVFGLFLSIFSIFLFSTDWHGNIIFIHKIHLFKSSIYMHTDMSLYAQFSAWVACSVKFSAWIVFSCNQTVYVMESERKRRRDSERTTAANNLL